jgi:heat shock protein HslJ
MITYFRFAFFCLLIVGFTAEAQQMTFESISNAVLAEVQDIPGVIKLQDGRWQGKPLVSGGTERPSVNVQQGSIFIGDVNGDGKADGAAFIVSSTGGSGIQLYLGLFLHSGSSYRNAENIPIGDRVQIADALIDSGGVIHLTLVRPGKGDGLCCPGEIVQRRWRWEGTRVKELPSVIIGRLSLTTLEGGQWRLESWKEGEPVDTNTAVTLRFYGEKVNGRSACNQYFASVQDGVNPGDITIGSAGSTRMMCSPEFMAAEDRYMRVIRSVVHFRFVFSKLYLEYEENGVRSALIFRRENRSTEQH